MMHFRALPCCLWSRAHRRAFRPAARAIVGHDDLVAFRGYLDANLGCDLALFSGIESVVDQFLGDDEQPFGGRVTGLRRQLLRATELGKPPGRERYPLQFRAGMVAGVRHLFHADQASADLRTLLGGLFQKSRVFPPLSPFISEGPEGPEGPLSNDRARDRARAA